MSEKYIAMRHVYFEIYTFRINALYCDAIINVTVRRNATLAQSTCTHMRAPVRVITSKYY